jgi:hypothetical protein
MTTKKRPTVKAKPTEAAEEKARKAKHTAKFALLPSSNAALVIDEYGKLFGEQDLGELIDSLSASIEDVNKGDLKRCEGMLTGQAYALQSIFMNLSRRAIRQQCLNQFEAYLKLALKAQSQCRATLEALAAIKNPPIILAKQANIANGHQQVNNGIPGQAPHAEEIKNQPNELLEQTHGERLDTRATGEAIGIDKAMATVE